MLVAIDVSRQQHAASINVAVPVASPHIRKTILEKTDHFFCIAFPPDFLAVGNYYRDFSQTTDEEVRQYMREFSSDELTSHE